MFEVNPLHATDSYKLSHRQMYKPGTTLIYSNFTPRSDKLFNGSFLYDGKMVVFGILGFAKEFLVESWNRNFFNKPKDEVVARYKRRMDTFLGEGSVPVDGFEMLHDLGYLPIVLKALPEGSRVQMKVPVLTIYNSHTDFAWLVNYLESTLSNMLWKQMVNATIAYEYRRVFDYYAEKTGTPKEVVQWQGHDFSSRGMSGPEDAARSGAAHLLSFTGSDTVSAIDYLEDYYNADAEKELISASVPATEHSVTCSNILTILDEVGDRLDAERVFLKRYITEIVPTGIASYVSDSFDFWGVVTQVLPALKDEIMNRDGRLVIRPDSGDPVHIICGDPNAPEGTPEHKGAIEVMWETFGGTETDKGFKQLDTHIGLIYGDSITLERQEAILSKLAAKGFASGNVVLGVGSYTYNYSTRDTFGSAVKATATAIGNELVEIYKDPATGDKTKKSARGLLRIDLVDDEYVLRDQVSPEEEDGGELAIVFNNGHVVETSLADIRARLLGQ